LVIGAITVVGILDRHCHSGVALVHDQGTLIVNGDDPALVDSAQGADSFVAVTSLSRESPTLRHHLEGGGSGVWLEENQIFSGEHDAHQSICESHSIPASLHGAAQFEIANALTAIAVATCVGIDNETIATAIMKFQTTSDILPGSFNVYTLDTCRVIIDSAAPSWHLRPLLRSLNSSNRRRQISVLGDLERLPAHDLQEIGRLLGRHHGAIILHSNKNPRLLDSLRKGIAMNDFPPVVIHLPTERRALNRALKTSRSDDLVLILTGADPGPAIRAVNRQQAQLQMQNGELL
jgi:cyanophycin synthetase